MHTKKLEEWSYADHSLHIIAWYPRSEMAIIPTWYRGVVDGVAMVAGNDIKKVRTRLEAIAAIHFAESGEFGQEEC